MTPDLRPYSDISFIITDLVTGCVHPTTRLISQALDGKNDEGETMSLESMTIILKDYRGAGDIRYELPFANRGQPGRFHDENGWCRSLVKGKDSWGYFHLGFPLLRSLHHSGDNIIHFLCVSVSSGRKKDLYPLVVVNAGAGNAATAKVLSQAANSLAKKGSEEYLTECAELNHIWLEHQ